MGSIHWSFWLVIGAGVSIASYQIDFEKLFLFFWVGIFFVAFGAIKFIFAFLKKQMEPKKVKRKKNQRASQGDYNSNFGKQAIHHQHENNRNQHNQNSHKQQQANMQQQRRFCPYCRHPIQPGFAFCPQCGARV